MDKAIRAIAVEEKKTKRFEELSKALAHPWDETWEAESAGIKYRVYFQDWNTWSDSDPGEVALLKFLEKTRHHRIAVMEDGSTIYHAEAGTDDDCVELFNTIPDWPAAIKALFGKSHIEKAPDDISCDRLKSIIRSLVDNESAGADPDYFRELMEDIFTEEELRLLDLEGYMSEEEEDEDEEY